MRLPLAIPAASRSWFEPFASIRWLTVIAASCASSARQLTPSSAGVDHARKRHRGDELIVADLLAVTSLVDVWQLDPFDLTLVLHLHVEGSLDGARQRQSRRHHPDTSGCCTPAPHEGTDRPSDHVFDLWDRDVARFHQAADIARVRGPDFSLYGNMKCSAMPPRALLDPVCQVTLGTFRHWGIAHVIKARPQSETRLSHRGGGP